MCFMTEDSRCVICMSLLLHCDDCKPGLNSNSYTNLHLTCYDPTKTYSRIMNSNSNIPRTCLCGSDGDGLRSCAADVFSLGALLSDWAQLPPRSVMERDLVNDPR